MRPGGRFPLDWVAIDSSRVIDVRAELASSGSVRSGPFGQNRRMVGRDKYRVNVLNHIFRSISYEKTGIEGPVVRVSQGKGVCRPVSGVRQVECRLSVDRCLSCSVMGCWGHRIALWPTIKIPHDRSVDSLLRPCGRGVSLESLVFRTSLSRSSGDAANRPLMGAICCPLGWWDITLPPPARRQVL